jgi:hypothetical protein
MTADPAPEPFPQTPSPPTVDADMPAPTSVPPPPVREVRELSPVTMFEPDSRNYMDLRPIPVASDDVEVGGGVGPKDSSAVVPADSSPEQDVSDVMEQISLQAPPAPTVPVVKGSGTPPPSAILKPPS